MTDMTRYLSFWGTALFLFTGPVAVCTIYFGGYEYIELPLAIFLLFVGRMSAKLRPSRLWSETVLLYFLPAALSIIPASLGLCTRTDIRYDCYFLNDAVTRMLHLVLYFIVVTGIFSMRFKDSSAYARMPYIYAMGAFAILGIMGLWQAAHYLTGVWCPEVETRNRMYFAMDSGLFRVTSFADEPSFLAAVMIDAVLIFLFLKKYVLMFLSLAVVVFSLSFGGYAEMAVLFAAYFFIERRRVKYKVLTGVAAGVVFLFALFPELADIIGVIADRPELQSGFSAEDTARTHDYLNVLSAWKHDGILPMLFGHGLSGLEYAMDAGRTIFPTSNNLYLDTLFDSGLFGCSCIMVLFSRLWKRAYKGTAGTADGNPVPVLFILHIVLSSCYRGDGSSARFMCLFVVMHCFFNLMNRQKTEKSKDILYETHYQC